MCCCIFVTNGSVLNFVLLTQLALLAYINGDPRGKDLYNATVGVNLAMNLHQKFKPTTKSDVLRVRFILI